MLLEKKNVSYKSGKQILGFFLIIPATVFILLDIIIPIVWNIILSFAEWNGMDSVKWVGLENIYKFFNDSVTVSSLYNSFIVAITSALIAIMAGLILAVMVYKMQRTEGAIYRLIFFTPTMIPLTTVGLLFVFIYSSDVGLLNNFLEVVGLSSLKHAWLAEESTVLMSIAFTGGWRMAGLTMMLSYTAIMSIPGSLLEAGKIDGASFLKQVRLVILPLIKPTLQICAMLTLIITFRTYDLVYTMTKGGPGDASRTMPIRILDIGFSYNEFGYAAAAGTIFTISVIVLVLIMQRIMKGEVYEY